jgi:PAS domain S-box-containing protein
MNPEPRQPPELAASELPLLDLHGAILDSVADGIFGLTTTGITTFANPAVTRLTGWLPEELIGRHQHAVIHHTRADGTPFPAHECPIYAVCRHGNVHHQDEDIFWRKDGSSFPVSYTATPLRKEGSICGAVVIFQDITLQKKKAMEERDRSLELERLVKQKTAELQRTNAQLSSVLKSASFVAIIAADLEGAITLFNEGAEKMLGYSASEVIGKITPAPFHLAAEVEARSRELSLLFGRPVIGMDVFTLCARQGIPEVREWTYVRKDGSHLPVYLGITALLDEDGVCDGTLGVAYDISERKSAEAAQRAAVEAAESANRAKSDFLATMSHEIRTPMNGIIGMANLLLNSNLDPVQRSRALTLRESGDALLRVLNDILDFSKIEAGKLQIESHPCDLRSLTEGVADLLALRAQEKNLELICAIEPGLVTHRLADSNRLRQILLNLVGNAIKFTHRGHILLRLSQCVEGDADAVRFDVFDTGIGVPREKQHLLFKRFSQADASTSRQYGGTGLGLSIVAGLLQSMGGDLGFHSEQGQGSHFWFTVSLPLQTDFPAPPALSLAGKRILVVDDNAESARVLGAQLEFWHAEVEYAVDYESALIRLDLQGRPRFDLFIVDVDASSTRAGCPEETLRRDPRFAFTPIIFVTPLMSATSWGSSDGNAPGAPDSYVKRISKPVKQAELCACLAYTCGLKPPVLPSSGPAKTPRLDVASRARHRLLLVEDNFVNQKVAMGMLEQFGYRADLVSEGNAALRALRQTEYTLVLTDCQMPEMDGYELSRLIRQPSSGVLNPKIPIIALTANSLSADREQCLAAGMDDFLTKPLKPELLDEVLSRWIASTVPAGPSDYQPETPSSPGPEFDENGLLYRMMGNQDLAKRVARAFLDTMPQQLAALEEAIESSDAKTAVLAAHSIRGSAANAGGCRLCELAAELEDLGEGAILDAAAQALPQLSSAMQSLATAIQQFCHSSD